MGNSEREATKKTIYDLFNECTVRIPLPGSSSGYGTGFFVAPGLILTCAHVVKTDQSAPVPVNVYWKDQTFPASTKTYLPDQSPNNPGPDLALLQVDIKKHPCVYLNEAAEPGNELYTYGYTDENPDGAATTFELEGQTGDKNPALKFKAGQVRPGSSGAPLLNMHTHYVCGLIRFTRARDKDLGGIAISTKTVWHFMPELQLMQRKFHRWNRQWERYVNGPFAYISRRTIIAGLAILVSGAGFVGWEIFHPQPPQPSDNQPRYKTLFTYTEHIASVWTVAWSPDGKFIASADPGTDINNGPTIRIWNALTGVDKRIYRSQFQPAQQVTWSPDGKRIASASRDGTIRIWNVLIGDTQSYIYGHQVANDYVIAVAWSPDGTRIASGHFDKTVKVWEAGNGRFQHTLTGHTEPIRCLTWSPDSKNIASGSDDQTVRVWDAQKGTLLCTYKGHFDTIQSIAWSPDGTSIASGSTDKTVHVWYPSPPMGQLIYSYPGHSDFVTAVAWSPDSRRIVSVSFDKQAHVWDAKSGNRVYVYGAHTDKLRSVSWATMTSYIATGGDDKTVRVWQDERS